MTLTKKQLAEARRIIASRAGKKSAKGMTAKQRKARATKASMAAAEKRSSEANRRKKTLG